MIQYYYTFIRQVESCICNAVLYLDLCFGTVKAGGYCLDNIGIELFCGFVLMLMSISVSLRVILS